MSAVILRKYCASSMRCKPMSSAPVTGVKARKPSIRSWKRNRLNGLLKGGPMSLQELKNQFGEYARGIKLNLSSVLSEEGAPDLNRNQIYGIALASAYATRDLALITAIQEEA